MEQACWHLISIGHQRIGIILGPETHVPSLLKLAAFQAAIGVAGADHSSSLVERTMFSRGRTGSCQQIAQAGCHRDRLRE